MTAIWTKVQSPLGPLMIVTHRNGAGRPVLGGLDFADREARLVALLDKAPWAMEGRQGRADSEIASALEAYFTGELRALDDLAAEPWGSPFERSVWDALRRIPVGSTTSYGALAKALAKALGRPTAARAVGRANGRNPVSLVIPCHRVIGASGALTGYAGGLERKSWLLRHEGVSLV